MDFSEHETSVLRYRLDGIGLRDIAVMKMGRGNGLPFPFPTDL
jgi:hypothetical protein